MGSQDLTWFPHKIGSVSFHTTGIRVLFPFLIAFAYFLGSFLLLPPDKALILGGLMIAYMIPPSGKESIIPVGIILGIPWMMMAATVVLQDIVTGLFMILNLDIAFRIPYVGQWISQFLLRGKEFMAERPWLSRWNILGLAFFVMLPFQGTGGVGAALVGWMMSLTPEMILVAIGIGAIVESLFFALGSDLIWRFIFTNLTLALVVFLVMVVITSLIVYLPRYWSKVYIWNWEKK